MKQTGIKKGKDTEIFVSQEVKDIVEANGLTGFSFEEVWRDDETDRN